MRIAVITDLHLGYTGESQWHNYKMWSDAEAVVNAAVQQINAEKPDLTLILGDLTESGKTEEVNTAFEILNKLDSDWFTVSGNHDRKAFETGDFMRNFADHLPNPYLTFGDIGLLTLSELWPREDKHVVRMDWETLQPALDTILANPPSILLIMGHYPLIEEHEHAAKYDGLYAGHWVDGEELLRTLESSLAGRMIVLCGHQHWHHIMQTPTVLQCTTASMTEYPMELRMLTIEDNQVSIETLETASPDIASRSLIEATWVRGEESDRTCQVSLPLSHND